MLEGFPYAHVKFPSTARAQVTDQHAINGTIISSSPTLQPQEVQSPLTLDMYGLRECHLHAALAACEFPTVVFGSGFEPHVASELSAPSDAVTVLIAHFRLKRL